MNRRWISLLFVVVLIDVTILQNQIVDGFQSIQSIHHFNYIVRNNQQQQQRHQQLLSPRYMADEIRTIPLSETEKLDEALLTSIVVNGDAATDSENYVINGSNAIETNNKSTDDIGIRNDDSTVSTTTTTTTTTTKSVPFPIVLWRFTRPHTLIGSALAIPSLHLLAAPTIRSIWTMNHLISILFAMIPSLLMNLYITGLNQITDVEIDKINKPNLPIAAGILKQRDAIITCIIALIVSLYIGTYAHPIYSTQGLQVALWGSGILGTLYSLEPFRLKRYPFLAAFCIVAVRGTIINASFFAHAMAAAFHQPSTTVISCLMNDPRCLFSSIFFGIFGVVIALMKDVPDVLGDKTSNVRTFSVRMGPERIFHLSRKILMGLFYVCGASFVQLAIRASTFQLATCRYLTAIGSFVAAISVRQQSKEVDPSSPSQVYNYYMHLWKIFLCYIFNATVCKIVNCFGTKTNTNLLTAGKKQFDSRYVNEIQTA